MSCMIENLYDVISRYGPEFKFTIELLEYVAKWENGHGFIKKLVNSNYQVSTLGERIQLKLDFYKRVVKN